MTTALSTDGILVNNSTKIHPIAGEMPLNKHQKAFYWMFILAIFICWSPVKALAIIAPYLVVGWYLLRSRSAHGFRGIMIWSSLWGLLLSLHLLFNQEFILQNGLLAVITYGAFLPIFVVAPKYLVNSTLLHKIQNVIKAVIVVQSIIGIVQAVYNALQSGSFDVNNGDAVAGTISMSLLLDGSLSNPMFAINMTFLLIMLLPALMNRQSGWFVCFLGAFSLILASVIHVLFYLTIAVSIAFLIHRPTLKRNSKRFLLTVGLVISLPLFVYGLLSTNLSTLPTYLEWFFGGSSPRAIVLQRAFIEMPERYEHLPIIGLGPGQFSSIASEIGSGLYFGAGTVSDSTPFLHARISTAAETYILDLWHGFSFGSTYQPRSSWLSVYAELGLGILLVLCSFVLFLLIRTSLLTKTKEQQWIAVSFSSGILFLFFLGFQYNYWEVPQAILVGVLCLQILYASLNPIPRLFQSS